jgi:hypothetical protein
VRVLLSLSNIFDRVMALGLTKFHSILSFPEFLLKHILRPCADFLYCRLPEMKYRSSLNFVVINQYLTELWLMTIGLSEYHSIFLSLAYLLCALVMELHTRYKCSLHENRFLDPRSYLKCAMGGFLVSFRGKRPISKQDWSYCVYAPNWYFSK